MLLIVSHHYVVNSGLMDANGPIYSNPLSLHSIYLLIMGAWGKIGINCFLLISGYFMCKSNITAKKFAKLFLEIMFYSIAINGVFWISGYSQFSVKELIKALLPVIDIGNDFVSAYLVFFLFIPFLNILICNMTEVQHIRLLLLCSFTYIFLGTIPFLSVRMNYVSWFIVLYLIAAYIRIYPKRIFVNMRFWGIMTIVSVIISGASVIGCSWLGVKFNQNMAYEFVTDSNTFLAVCTAISAFMFFKNLNISYNRYINTIAASTFGVLLIHANSNTMREWLWKDVFNNVGMYSTHFGYVHVLLTVILVFSTCVIIDYLRIHMIELPFFRFWDKNWISFLLKLQRVDEKLWDRFKRV